MSAQHEALGKEVLEESTYRASSTDPLSVRRAAVRYSKADWNSIPEWKSEVDVNTLFRTIRDSRFLPDPDDQSTPRRIPWLYPDDGCMVRAALWIHQLAKIQPELPKPAKVYIFGNLKLSSPYSTSDLEFSYHVAPAVRFGGEVLVFDPTLEIDAPLTLENWAEKMLGQAKWGNYAICDASSFNVDDSCHDNPTGDRSAFHHARHFLRLERSRIQELGLNLNLLSSEHPW